MLRCPSCGQENPEGFRFCGACGAGLASPRAREVRKTVTVLFSDVTGSTALGERLDPESLRHVMGRYLEEMKDVLERHGGTVEKFIGDAVMAVFGIPTLHEDDAPARAARRLGDARAARVASTPSSKATSGFALKLGSASTPAKSLPVRAPPGSGWRRATQSTSPPASSRRPHQARSCSASRRWSSPARAVEVESVEPLSLKGKAESRSPRTSWSESSRGAGLRAAFDAPLVGRQEGAHAGARRLRPSGLGTPLPALHGSRLARHRQVTSRPGARS